MKVQELKGALLDYWAGKADGLAVFTNGSTCFLDARVYGRTGQSCIHYSPSTNWEQGGPIIEREKIMLNPIDPVVWGAGIEAERLAGESFMVYENGSTAPEAAMRCFVASKFGEEVPDASTAKED